MFGCWRYDESMTTSKIAVTVPRQTLGAVEKRRRVLGMTRSAVVSAALDAWLADQSMTREERAYILAYLREPESSNERSNSSALALAALATAEPWDAPASPKRARRARTR